MPVPFKKFTGKVVPIDYDNVDTDQIIPAQFLKITERDGLSNYLFYRWRHDQSGNKTKSFVLDMDEFKGASIIVAGRNFGIGSSRENAVWALLDYGIRCIIAVSFGDIFYNNCIRNGLLCISLDEDNVTAMRVLASKGNLFITIDLEKQKISFDDREISFSIGADAKYKLLHGIDDIQLTLSRYEMRIREYEEKMESFLKPSRSNT